MDGTTRACAGCVTWISVLCVILVTASSLAPSITHCELLEHANITCYWTAVSSETSRYMLQVNMTYCLHNTDYKTVGSCTTADTWCSVNIGSAGHCFCVDVQAFCPSTSARSPRRCFAGINEVKMYPPRFTRLTTIPGNSHCLKLEWTDDMSVTLPSERAHRVIQIEYSIPHQAQSWNVSSVLHDWKMELCGLYPGTKHSVRLRAQDSRASHHWSGWSSIREAITAESAPGAVPELWRHIQPTDMSGQRHITLLWKPLQWPDTNGVILSYAASCWSDLDPPHQDCGRLDSSVTSCVVSVSANPCICNLTASNSAGTSPEAYIRIPGDRDAVLPSPVSISVNALDDFQLKVEWTAAVNQSDTSFVIEWFPITDNTFGGAYWKRLNGSARSFIITEGVLPEVPYNVSVQVLHEKTTRAPIFATGFTRQGAPSAGPKLKVLQTTGSSVILKWNSVPLEKLHGFIQNYTVVYVTNGKMKSQVLEGDVEQFSLTGLSAGEYAICVKAHTVAGSAEGPWVTVAVGNDYLPIVAILVCTTGGLLILVITLSQGERIQHCLWPTIPDPSKTSLSTWARGSRSQLVFMGRTTGLCDHPCEEHQQACSFSDHSILSKTVIQEIFPRPLSAKTAKRKTHQPTHKVNAEEPSEDLSTEVSSRNNVMAKPQTPRAPSGCPPIADCCFGRDTVDERNLMERLRLCGQSPPAPEALARADKVDSSNLLYKKDFTSRSESTCYPNIVYTHYLPVPDLQLDFRKEAKDFTNLIHKSNLLSPLESCCRMHISTSYLPVPESSLDYASFPLETGHPTDCSPRSKIESSSHSHLSTIYVQVPVTHRNFTMEAEDSANFQKKGTLSGSECSSQQACQSSPICKEFEEDHTYRSLGQGEDPLQFSLQ
ncbi:interleukin-31 receptor subunit alpha isoform X2 [Electrophorus electricus]|uniref:interleukin-31 receptor subunit alpha isoform X2 n=1 Tax=Electrophorus electricus TaxID=8005 RepID=UPI0015CFE8C3|nr:interleukin-31 receptor subunit alpha isoform X2 [Electrophorus electricus]